MRLRVACVAAAVAAASPSAMAPDPAAAPQVVLAGATPTHLRRLTADDQGARSIRRRLHSIGGSGEARDYVVGRTYEPRRRLQASQSDTIEALTLEEDLVHIVPTAAAGPWSCLLDTADNLFVPLRWSADSGNPECMGAAGGGCQREADPDACAVHVATPTAAVSTVCTAAQVADAAHWCGIAAAGLPAWPASALMCLDRVPVSDANPEGVTVVPCTKVDLKFDLRAGSQLGGFMAGVSGTSIYQPPVRCADYTGDAANPSTTCPLGCIFTPAADVVAATTASCTGTANTPTEECVAPICSITHRDIGNPVATWESDPNGFAHAVPNGFPELEQTNGIACTGLLHSSTNPLTGCSYTAPNPEVIEDCVATAPDVVEVCVAVDDAVPADVAACSNVLLGAASSGSDCAAVTYTPGCAYTSGTAGCPAGCTDDSTTCSGTATPVARCDYTAPTFVDRACGELDITATCDLDATTDGSADCFAGCASTEASADGQTAATCTGVSTHTYYTQSTCEGSGVACTYVAPVAEGSIVPEACDAPTCTLTAPGDSLSCTGAESCVETAASQTESCAPIPGGSDSRCADVTLGLDWASAQACAKISTKPDCVYTSGTTGCPDGCVDDGTTCEGVDSQHPQGSSVAQCVYTGAHVDVDGWACGNVTLGTTLTEESCNHIWTDNNVRQSGCTYTPPNYGCVYNSDTVPTCDLDPLTDGTAECPAGCVEVVDADIVAAVTETCEYPSLGTNPGDPMSNTVYTPFRVDVNTPVNNLYCWDGYIPGTAEVPSTTCTPGCFFQPATEYEAAIPEVCNGTAITIADLDPNTNPMTCDLDSTTDGTSVCPDGCNQYMAVPGIPAEEEACTPFSEVSVHSPSGATPHLRCLPVFSLWDLFR